MAVPWWESRQMALSRNCSAAAIHCQVAQAPACQRREGGRTRRIPTCRPKEPVSNFEEVQTSSNLWPKGDNPGTGGLIAY